MAQSTNVTFQTVQELVDALVQVWEEIPQETIYHILRSILKCCRGVIQQVEAMHSTEPHFDLFEGQCITVGSACSVFFHFNFELDSNSCNTFVSIFYFHRKCPCDSGVSTCIYVKNKTINKNNQQMVEVG